jgi:hypothetical protein
MPIIQNEATKLNIAMGPSECYSFTNEKAKHCRDPNQHDTQNETTKPNTAEDLTFTCNASKIKPHKGTPSQTPSANQENPH